MPTYNATYGIWEPTPEEIAAQQQSQGSGNGTSVYGSVDPNQTYGGEVVIPSSAEGRPDGQSQGTIVRDGSGNVITSNTETRNHDPTLGVNKDAYVPPGYQDSQDWIRQQMEAAAQRQAPQTTAVNLGPLVTSQGVNIGPMQQSQGVTLGPAAQAAGVTIAPAGQARASLAGPAAQAQDSAVRGDLMQALQYQGGLMRGENSVAALQHKRLSDAAMAQQMSMGASARPGTGAMAQRIAAQNMGRISGDMAGRLQEAQLAERNTAAQQYANFGGLIRGQDNQLSMFNTGQTNDTSRLNAQLGTQTGIANAGFQTNTNIAQGQLSGQTNMFNAGQSNQMAQAQGNLSQQNNQFNAGQNNTASMRQAELSQQNNQYNTGQSNQYNYNQANLSQQNNQFNADIQIKQQQVNDQAQATYVAAQQRNMQMYQQGMMSYEDMINANRQAELERQNRIDLAKMAIEANDPSLADRLWGMANGIITGGATIGAAAVGKP